MPEKKIKIRLFTLPNLLTLGNLFCGCLAILYALHCGSPDILDALRLDELQFVFWLLAGAAVFDFLDGFAARLTGQYSALGRELDSLADMVSFGVAPAAILFRIHQAAGGIGAWGFFVFVVALFSALRLAKFNIDESQHDDFIGLPTPANAIFIASAGHIYASGLFAVQPWLVLLAAAILSCLLIAPVCMFSLKFKHFGWRGNEWRYLFLLAALAGVVVWGILAIPFIITGYVAGSVVKHSAQV